MTDAASATRQPADRPLRVAVSGASGFLGTELVRALRADGHDVVRLVRRSAASDDEVRWDPAQGILDERLLDTLDAVVNLSGASLYRLPWTPSYKRELVDSRVAPARTIAEAISRSSDPPAVFLSASTVGYYGDRPGERLTEDSRRGDGFVTELVEQWEEAANPAREVTRVVHTRSGIVLGRGGALENLARFTRIGAGIRLGTGGDLWPWISLKDEVRGIRHLLTSQLRGPVNLVGPTTATSGRISDHLAKRMGKRMHVTVPEWVIRTPLPDAAALAFASQEVVPQKLTADGFTWEHETVEQAIDAAFTFRSRARAQSPA